MSLGTLLPFATAGAQLATLTGVPVSPETLRSLTEAAGQALDAQLQEDAATVDRTKAPSAQSIPLRTSWSLRPMACWCAIETGGMR